MNAYLTIIIPYYKKINSLEQLLCSIPQKESIEVIVVNDDDNIDTQFFNLLRCFPKVKFFEQLPGKRWAGSARNLGLSKAKGDFVLFADTDDYFIDGFFDILLSYFDKKFDMVFFRPASSLEGGGYSSRHLSYSMLIDDYFNKKNEEILYKFHVPWSKLYRREYLVNQDIFFDEIVASNDVNFSLKASYFARDNYAVDKRSIYCVVESSSSLTKAKTIENAKSRFFALCRYNDFLMSNNDNNLAAMIGRLLPFLKVDFKFFIKKLILCKSKGYPIFYSRRNIIRALKLYFFKKSSQN